jgi:DNA-binding NarL/FixJ family response regulator
MITKNRILMVDDNEPFRRALRDFLSQEPDFEIVGEAGNLAEAIRAIGDLSPHLVLTDLSMPDASGVEAVTEIRRLYPEVKLLVISSHREREYKGLCHEAGADGYIVKDTVYEALRDLIRAVLVGGTRSGEDAPDETVPS